MKLVDIPKWLDTPEGVCSVAAVCDYGIESSLYWVVVAENGQIWRFANEYVRAVKNVTAERPAPERVSRPVTVVSER